MMIVLASINMLIRHHFPTHDPYLKSLSTGFPRFSDLAYFCIPYASARLATALFCFSRLLIRYLISIYSASMILKPATVPLKWVYLTRLFP